MQQPPRSQPWRYMLSFAAGGPLVGYFLLSLLAGPPGLIGGLYLSLLGFPILAAYAVGVAPAALAGWVAGWSLRWGRVWLFLLVATVAGAVFTMALNVLTSRREGLADYATAAALGGGSGLACALINLKSTGLGPDLKLPAFVQRWPAGNVLLGVLIVVMIIMVTTLLLPAL